MITNRRLKHFITLFLSPFLISGLLLHPAIITFSHAASFITSDGTMGTKINQAGNIYNINGGTIKGTNQFHSFGLFSVGTGDAASFNGPSWIANIIGRITGGQSSIIDGILRSTITGANLYLLNPYGVLFGPNASLDVTGSFHVSTADYLRLSDGGIYYSNPLRSSVLTTASPVAFGFLSNNPAPITIQESFLQVPRYKTLSVIGGDINITGGPSGYIYAPSGQINIASVASPGEVIPVESRNAPDLQMSSFSRLGNINLLDGAYLDVSSSRGGGSVVIRGGKLLIENSYIVADTTGNIDGARVGIDIGITGDLVVNGGGLYTDTYGSGKGGDINIATNTLQMSGGGQITASSYADGQGGSIYINAADQVILSGSPGDGTGIYSMAQGSSGSGGNIQITAGNLEIDGGGLIASVTSGQGNGGATIITANNILLDGGNQTQAGMYAETLGSGWGGDISITTNTLEMKGGAQIAAITTADGQSGSIYINADKVNLSATPGFPTGIFSQTLGSGGGGNIQIITGSLQNNGGFIDLSTWGQGNGGSLVVIAENILLDAGNQIGVGSGMTSNAYASGKAGDINIYTSTLQMSGGGQISAGTSADGQGGSVNILADQVNLSATPGIATGIFSQTSGSGSAGDIVVTAGNLQITGGQINAATSGQGNGGMLIVTAKNILLDGGGVVIPQAGVGVYADTSGSGKAGNILISANTLEMKGGAQISASTSADGQGGFISINADQMNISTTPGIPTAISSQTSGSGSAGNIMVTAGNLQITGGEINVVTWGQGNGGMLIVTAKNILLDGGNQTQAVGVGMYADTLASGKAGNILITTNTLEIKGGAQISASTRADGQGGFIYINADQVILSDPADMGTGIYSIAYTSGSGGFIDIIAGNLQITGGQINAATSGQGNGGILFVNAKDILLDGGNRTHAVGVGMYTDTSSSGKAGNILITTNTLEIKGGAQISASTRADGQGGLISINADQVNLSGVPGGVPGGFGGSNYNTGILSSAFGSGSGGFIDITAGNLQINDGAKIDSGTTGSGRAGNIALTVPWITMANGGGIVAETLGSGTGGNIQLSGGQIQLFNGAFISSKSSGAGNAGDININAADTLRMKNSSITTEATYSDGGNIYIKAGYMVELIDSKITASVGGGPQTTGGNITIDPEYVILNDSQIIANAYEGKGGNIRIIADVFLASPDSIVDASSQLGISGTVNIQAPIQNISGTLAPMQGNFLSAEALLRDRCIARIRGESISSFVVSGRDGLPIRPGSVLPSPIY